MSSSASLNRLVKLSVEIHSIVKMFPVLWKALQCIQPMEQIDIAVCDHTGRHVHRLLPTSPECKALRVSSLNPGGWRNSSQIHLHSQSPCLTNLKTPYCFDCSLNLWGPLQVTYITLSGCVSHPLFLDLLKRISETLEELKVLYALSHLRHFGVLMILPHLKNIKSCWADILPLLIFVGVCMPALHGVIVCNTPYSHIV